jgi:hypothetical protein
MLFSVLVESLPLTVRLERCPSLQMIDAVLIPINFACPDAASSGATLSGSTFAAVVAAGLVVAKFAL